MLKSWTKWHDDEASVDHFGSPTTRDLTYSLQGDEDPGLHCFMRVLHLVGEKWWASEKKKEHDAEKKSKKEGTGILTCGKTSNHT